VIQPPAASATQITVLVTVSAPACGSRRKPSVSGQISPIELSIKPAPPIDVAQSRTRPRYRSARNPNTSETATTTTIASGMLASPVVRTE